MSQALASWLVLLIPVALAASVAGWAWSKVKRPFLFLCLAVLSLLALQAVAVFFIAGYLPPGEPHSAYLQATGLVAGLVVVLGCPLLWFLYRGLRHVGSSTGGA